MVQGIQFLTKKGFNPHNLSNRKRVWEAEQKAAVDAAAAAERELTLQRERDEAAILQARGETPRVAFLYEHPPGMPKKKEESKMNDSNQAPSSGKITSEAQPDLSQSRPDDDPATAAFRRLLAGNSAASETSNPEDDEDIRNRAHYSEGVLRGSIIPRPDADSQPQPSKPDPNKSSSLSALEKAVGRKKGSTATTLEEQIARFPALANAPRATKAPTTNMTFQPLGCQIRNVRCTRCGEWGHSVGERECSLTGWNPFAMPSRRLPEEDTPREPGTVVRTTQKMSTDNKYRNEDDSDECAISRRSEKKKKKKRKKSSHKRNYQSDSDSDERRKSKKRKKKR